MKTLNLPNPDEINLVNLWKPKGICRCKDETWWRETLIHFTQINPILKHGVNIILKCQVCNVILGEQTIIFHEGKSDICDSCNYWAYGLEAPLDFAYIYHDTYLVTA